MFTKITFEDPKKFKGFRIQNSIPVFLDILKIADFWSKNADVSRTQGVCQVIYVVFGSSLGKV